MPESKSLKLRPACFCFSIKFINNIFHSPVFLLDVLQLPEEFKSISLKNEMNLEDQIVLGSF